MARSRSMKREADGAGGALTAEQGLTLCRYVRQRIHAQLGGPPAHAPDAPAFRAPAATFVTLRWPTGELQGCIGSLEAFLPLREDVEKNGLSAAFRDPRGVRLLPAQVDLLQVELSVLSPLSPIPFTDERSALAQLEPGVDGVVFQSGGRRATFLPQVWENMSTREEFLGELKQKAGFPADYWAPDVELFRYHVQKFKDAPTASGDAP